MKWGLLGCGVIGERRAQALPQGVKLVSCFDPNTERSQRIASLYSCRVENTAEDLLQKDKVDAVIIAGINSVLVPLVQTALNQGIHVLVEKPAARSFLELSKLTNNKNCVIKVGFNHRFHPAFFDIQKKLAENVDDPIMFIRAQYGNGARVGFDREWRSQVELAGGGELLDQGVHVLDLASCLLPDLKVLSGVTRTHFWDMSVDDNAWALLSSEAGSTFSMHVSSTEWKNEFRFEVYTRKVKYQWHGLGRSYGPEKLTIFRMKPEMGPPHVEELTYPPEDLSWKLENENFLNAILNQDRINGGYQDALTCLRLVEDIYKSSKKSQINSKLQHPLWWQQP